MVSASFALISVSSCIFCIFVGMCGFVVSSSFASFACGPMGAWCWSRVRLRCGFFVRATSMSTGFVAMATSWARARYLSCCLICVVNVLLIICVRNSTTCVICVFSADHCRGASYRQTSSSCSGGARSPTLMFGYPYLPMKGAGELPVNASLVVSGIALKSAALRMRSLSLYVMFLINMCSENSTSIYSSRHVFILIILLVSSGKKFSALEEAQLRDFFWCS